VNVVGSCARHRYLAALVILALASPAAARFRVCTFVFNGPEEVDVFRTRLAPEDFEIVDLSPALAAPAPTTGGRVSSSDHLCRTDLRCDVVVYSAEFGGRFFGRSGSSVSLQELEEASCQPRCAGLFHTPQEVFLLACNTLATKDQDTRTPAEYREVLLAHGFEQADAERTVAIRYGPLGQSFREAERRIFAGVPRLYGFSSVAARGERTAVQLDRYFTATGDYKRHLLEAWGDPSSNRPLTEAFARTGMVQTSGVGADERTTADRDRVCRVYDDGAPLVDRLRVVRDLMAREDALSFVPTVEAFLARHDPAAFDAEERAVLAEVQASAGAREQVLRLVDQLDASALRFELAHLAERLGWMVPEDLRRLAVDDVRQLLVRTLTSELVDVTCEITKHEAVGDAFHSADLPDDLFRDAEGLRLVTCLAPPDQALNARLLAALDDRDESVRAWAAYALSRRLPLDDATRVFLAHRIDDESAEVRGRLRWMLRVEERPSEPLRQARR
jgi:hypothetical protein